MYGEHNYDWRDLFLFSNNTLFIQMFWNGPGGGDRNIKAAKVNTNIDIVVLSINVF